MSDQQHFTTRRGFVAAMGFGALGLYGTWAAYGASPFPFSSLFTDPVPHDAHAALLAHQAQDGVQASVAPDVNAHTEAALTPDQFAERQAAFLKRFRRDDGSVHPEAGHDEGDLPAMLGLPATPAPMAAHDHGAMPDHSAMPGHGVAEDHAAMSSPDANHDGDHATVPTPLPAPMAPHDGGEHTGSEAIDVYVAANRYAFDPDHLVLKQGQRYRFLMLASDVTHGAAIALGRGSRIVRLRPGIVTSLELTFLSAGDHLLYCTVHCGAGHDMMHAKITVA